MSTNTITTTLTLDTTTSLYDSDNPFDFNPIHKWNGSVINFGLENPTYNLELTELLVNSNSASETTQKVHTTKYGGAEVYNEINRIIRLFFSNHPFDVEIFDYSFTVDLTSVEGFAAGPMSLIPHPELKISTFNSLRLTAGFNDAFPIVRKEIWPSKDYNTSTGRDNSGQPRITLGWSDILAIRCSNPQWTNEIDCERPAYCTYIIHTDETVCIADYCNDLTWWNEPDCLAAGLCSWNPYNNDESLCLEQRCSNTSYSSQFSCVNAGECTNTNYGSSKDNCESARCSNTVYEYNYWGCVGEGICTNASYNNNRSGCEEIRCSNTSYTSSSTCLAVGTCNGNSSYNNNQSGCLQSRCSNPTYLNNYSGCVNEGICTNASYNNNPIGCIGNYCSNPSLTSSSTCLAVGTCNGNSSYNNNQSGCVNEYECRDNQGNVTGYSDSASCLNVGVCSYSTWNNNPYECNRRGECWERTTLLGNYDTYRGNITRKKCKEFDSTYFDAIKWTRNAPFLATLQWVWAGNTWSYSNTWQQQYTFASAGNSWSTVYTWSYSYSWAQQHTFYSANNTWGRQHTWTPYNYTWKTQHSWTSDNNNWGQQYQWISNWGHWIPSPETQAEFSNYVIHESKDTWTAPKVVIDDIPTTDLTVNLDYNDGVLRGYSHLEVPVSPAYCDNPNFFNYSDCQTPNGSWVESYQCSVSGFPTEYSCTQPRGFWTTLFQCSNPDYLSNQTGCESIRGTWINTGDSDSPSYSCTDETYTTEVSCESPNGTWDDVSFCSNPGWNDEISCESPNGFWDDVSFCTTSGFNNRTDCLANRGTWKYSREVYNTRATKVLYVSGKLTSQQFPQECSNSTWMSTMPTVDDQGIKIDTYSKDYCLSQGVCDDVIFNDNQTECESNGFAWTPSNTWDDIAPINWNDVIETIHISPVREDNNEFQDYNIVQFPAHGDVIGQQNKPSNVSSIIEPGRAGISWMPPEFWKTNLSQRDMNPPPTKYRIYRSNTWHYGVTSPTDYTLGIKKLVGEIDSTSDIGIHSFYEESDTLRAEGILPTQQVTYFVTSVFGTDIEGEFTNEIFSYYT